MDYRYTEDFAREMERAEWRAHDLRQEALGSLWHAIAAAFSRAWHRVVRAAGSCILPEG